MGENKYLVLSHSSNIYKESGNTSSKTRWRSATSRTWSSKRWPCRKIVARSPMPSSISGAISKAGDSEEKADFMLLLEKYQHSQASQEDLIKGIQTLLERYPNRYLTRLDATRRSIDETLAPRLDSQTPSSPAPGPTPECYALRGNGWGKKHATVNYVFDYSPYRLYAYHHLIMGRWPLVAIRSAQSGGSRPTEARPAQPTQNWKRRLWAPPSIPSIRTLTLKNALTI